MASSVVRLGTTVHVHEEKRIQLTAAGSIEISCPGLPDASQDETRLLAAFRAGDIWFSPQPYLEFKITVRIHGSLHTRSAREEFLSDVAGVIGNAKLWSDIHFTVISQLYDTGYNSERLSIILRLQPRSDVLSVTRPTRLPSSLEALFSSGESVQPPLGILTASIKSVDISISFLPLPPRLSPLRNFLNQPKSSAFDPSTVFRERDPTWTQELNTDGPNESRLLGNSNLQVENHPGSNAGDDFWESLDDDSPFSSQDSGVSSTSTSSCPDLVETIIDRVASISLLDSVFRAIFSSIPAGTHPKIRSRADVKTTGLIGIAPNVFNPTYRTEISHRACFIPSIAKGIVSLSSNTESPLVKSKLQALEISFRRNHHNELGWRNPLSAPETKDIIKCLLWKTMHHGLHKPEAPCKLTPLGSGIIPADGDDNSLFTSLDNDDDIPWSRSTQGSLFHFDDELEDEEDDILLTDYDQYDGDDDLVDETDLDILLSSPSAIAADNDIPESPSHTSVIFQDLNTPSPSSIMIIDAALSSPDVLPIQTSLPASPELDVHGLDLDMDMDMDIEIPSSEMEMLDCSSPVADTAEASPCAVRDIDMLL